MVTTLTVSGTTSLNGDVNLGDTTGDTITVAGVTNLDHTLTVAGDTALNTLVSVKLAWHGSCVVNVKQMLSFSGGGC